MHELTYDIILMVGCNGRSAEGFCYSISYISHRASASSFMYSLPRISRSASRHLARSLPACTPLAAGSHLDTFPLCFIVHPRPRLSSVLFTSSSSTMTDMNQGGDPSKKTYHKKATGNALTTVKNHAKEEDLKLYGSCFWYVILTLSIEYCPIIHVNTLQPLRSACLDISGTQSHPLPVHRSRSLQETPIPIRREPTRPRTRPPPRPNMEHPRVHRHYGVPRGLKRWRTPPTPRPTDSRYKPLMV